MKKFFMFAVSLFISLCVFSGVMLGVVILGGNEKNPEKTLSEPELKNSQIPLLAVFCDDKKLFAAYLLMDPENHTCKAVNVDCENIKNSPDTTGIYPFTGECFDFLSVPKSAFIALNTEEFKEAVDRAKTVTYVDPLTDAEYLLTGIKAVETLTAENFGLICENLAECSMEKGLETELLYYADLCENTLSMPRLLKNYNP